MVFAGIFLLVKTPLPRLGEAATVSVGYIIDVDVYNKYNVENLLGKWRQRV
jgi:hypothetical protein